MLRRLFIAVIVLVLAGVAFLAVGLLSAHLAIRRERAPLPPTSVVADSLAVAADRPVRLSVIHTATQLMPRSAVLNVDDDPHPNEPYSMTHSSFVLEWADGRILLIDTGMSREQALNFGWPLETFAGAAPMHPLLSVADRLAERRAQVQGILFTHLHTDHTGGIVELCQGAGHDIPVFMSEAQHDRPNHTTKPGLEQVQESGCGRPQRLAPQTLMDVPGFPGVFVLDAGGHTPGSQLIVASVAAPDGPHAFVFTGDIVNHIDGVRLDVPKPLLYRLLVVPEDDDRQSELRKYLRELNEARGFAVVVSHDQRAIEALKLPSWEP